MTGVGGDRQTVRQGFICLLPCRLTVRRRSPLPGLDQAALHFQPDSRVTLGLERGGRGVHSAGHNSGDAAVPVARLVVPRRLRQNSAPRGAAPSPTASRHATLTFENHRDSGPLSGPYVPVSCLRKSGHVRPIPGKYPSQDHYTALDKAWEIHAGLDSTPLSGTGTAHRVGH